MKLRRTAPFLVGPAGDPALLLDRAEIPAEAACGAELLDRIRATLVTGAADATLTVEEAQAIVLGQYEACLEFIYSHPSWSRVRAGEATRFLHAYLLENRHYLAAAPFRMATGVGGSPRPDALNELQARHVVEEADHDTYFENGLAAIGCDRALVRAARPWPATVEWIHLMRTVADSGPLPAALCSGLLEFTAGNRTAVAGWHEHVAAGGQVSADAMAAIFEHVKTDLGLGHGSNWKEAIEVAGLVTATQLADSLNEITLVAEAIVRWLDSLDEGLSGDLVGVMPELTRDAAAVPALLGGEADGLPVWPAEILHLAAHGDPSLTTGMRAALATAFAYGEGVIERTAPVEQAAGRLAGPYAHQPVDGGGAALEKLVGEWMRAIDGHRLWTEMTERPTLPLVYGWLVENHHYVAAIWQHCGAGIAACPDPRLRALLVHHLEEEFEHGAMFREGIDKARGGDFGGLPVAHMRPLPTTRSFTGMLRGLAQRDWKAYVLGVAYLQLTLRAEGDGPAARHVSFYEAVTGRLPEARPLLDVMRRHDAEDTDLGHAHDVRQMLDLLSEHSIGPDTLASAALVPQLTWSFLDGIRCHYAHGPAAVVQRAGWHTDAVTGS
ncbi:hypothetical protein [Microbispora sp. NPDC049125]|uniref:hypothetical protein n=1 Tax=Microbispora sp. NPDC049125 TaxID=3154929 RepID=UPI00346664E5